MDGSRRRWGFLRRTSHLLLVALAPLAVSAATFCVNYSLHPEVNRLREHQFSILSPEAQVDLASLQRDGHAAFAYLSVVEVATNAPHRADVFARRIPLLGTNEVWHGDLADVSQPIWRNYVLDQLAARAVARGFQGFFLDTMDSVEILERLEPARGTAFRDGLVTLVKALKARYPNQKIIVNRGFPLLARLTGAVDGVLVESLFQQYDPVTKSYRPVASSGSEWLLTVLRTIKAAGLPVYVLDYVEAGQLALAAGTAQRIRTEGFSPFVSTVELNGQFLAPFPPPAPIAVALPPPVNFQPAGPVQGEVARHVLNIFGNADPSVEELIRWPADSGVAEVSQMPLEWLGYEVTYLHAHRESLPAQVDSRVVAILLDHKLRLPPEREAEVARWLIAQKNRGLKILFLGDIPFQQQDVLVEVMRAFGFGGTGRQVLGVAGAVARVSAPAMNFETAASLSVAGFRDLRASPGSEVWYSVAGQSALSGPAQFDAIFIAPWGGVMLNPFVLFRRPDLNELWQVDPFAFYRAALGQPVFPVPDTTTRDGVRMFFTHIDGDGFRNRSSVHEERYSAEVILERVIQHYPYPFTCSIIEAEIRAQLAGQDPAEAGPLSALARRIFALPKVEAASHAYSHPFYWNVPDRTVELYPRARLELRPEFAGEPFSLEREILGSVSYIERDLLPPGKRVKLYLWSGNCRPWPTALRLVRELGIENLNGGETAISRKRPTVTRVAPRAVVWGDELQVTSANQNENIYLTQWRDPTDKESSLFAGFALARDGYERMEAPRRLKPVNIYFHFFSGDSLASLNALLTLFNWAMNQELHAVAASDYTKMVRDARATRVIRLSDTRWILESAGVHRTYRLPAGRWTPDLTTSRGVTGWRVVRDQLYLHTDGSPRVELALADNPPRHAHLISSTAAIQFTKLAPQEAAFTVRDIRTCHVTLGGFPASAAVTVVVNGRAADWAADAQGQVRLELPMEATVEVRGPAHSARLE